MSTRFFEIHDPEGNSIEVVEGYLSSRLHPEDKPSKLDT
jgi:hypothetical protein